VPDSGQGAVPSNSRECRVISRHHPPELRAVHDGLVYVDQTKILTQLFLVYAAYYHFGGKEVVTLFLITLEQNHIHLDEAGRHFKYAGLHIVRHERSRRAPIGWRMEEGDCVTFIGYLVRMRTDIRSTAATNRQRRSLKRKVFAPCPCFSNR
jgi:hypothetical protein